MAFQFPWTNLHELNLDWFLSKFKQFTNNYLGTTATVELIPTTEQPEVTVTGGTLDDDTDIVDPFTFNFKLPINSSGGGAVNSVNGKVGDVVLDKTDIGLGNVANVAQYSASNPPPYPVTSVNGDTGAVILDKTDIGLGNVANVAQYSASNPPPYPVTSVNGMTGDVIVQGGGGGGDVLSVNGQTGVVVLDNDDIGLGNVDNVQQYSASNPPPYPVTSVNGDTGAVTLDKTDIGLGNVDNVQQYSATNPPPYPVTSVNGMTGDVTISGNREVIESGTDTGWRYNKYSDGTYECWYNNNNFTTNAVNTAAGNIFRSTTMNLSYPSFANLDNIICNQVLTSSSGGFSWQAAWPTSNALSFLLFSVTQLASSSVRVSAYLYGTYS